MTEEATTIDVAVEEQQAETEELRSVADGGGDASNEVEPAGVFKLEHKSLGCGQYEWNLLLDDKKIAEFEADDWGVMPVIPSEELQEIVDILNGIA